MIGYIANVGARSPQGLSSLQIATAVRAGKLEPRTVHFEDKRGRDVGMCIGGGLGRECHGYQRLLGLAIPALNEAAADMHEQLGLEAEYAFPLVLALPQAGRADDDPRFETAFIAELGERAGVPLALDHMAIVRQDQAGMGEVLALAHGLLRDGHPAVIVGGVDSYYHPGVIKWLDDDCRLHALEAENGFIPGEGAAFAVLTTARSDAQLAQIRHAASADESGGEEQPNTAAAITELLHAAVEIGGPIGWTINDLNGERHRNREWNLAVGRAVEYGTPHSRWADDLGDIGAASGAMYMSIACRMWQIGCSPAAAAVVALASENGRRALVLLEEAE